MNRKALHGSVKTGGRDDWRTPAAVLERVRILGPIGLDPCTGLDNPVGARTWCTLAGLWRGVDGVLVCTELERGGLDLVPWLTWTDELVFVNPPYSEAKLWAAKVADEVAFDPDRKIVTLVAARPDTRWWRALTFLPDTLVAFWRGRLRFLTTDGVPGDPAPFPSALVLHGFRHREVASAFEGVADVWSPALA